MLGNGFFAIHPLRYGVTRVAAGGARRTIAVKEQALALLTARAFPHPLDLPAAWRDG